MTIKERAKAYADKCAMRTDCTIDELIWEVSYDEYLKIADEQKVIDIENAVNMHCILCKKNFDVVTCDGCDEQDIIRKAMEESK